MKRIYSFYTLLAVITLTLALLFSNSEVGAAIATDAAIAQTTTQVSEVSPSISSDERQIDALPQALLGHWVTNAGSTHSYFGQNKVIVVNTLNRQAEQQRSPNLHKQVMPYEIMSASETSNLVHLRVQTRSGWAQNRMLRFSGDRHSFVESIDLLGHPFSISWSYVDGQQQP